MSYRLSLKQNSGLPSCGVEASGGLGVWAGASQRTFNASVSYWLRWASSVGTITSGRSQSTGIVAPDERRALPLANDN